MLKSSKTLILIRHAHRDLDNREKDNGLSDHGREQTKKLVTFGSARLEGCEPVFLSSPKKRCQETLAPLAEKLKTKMKIDPRLTEGTASESSEKFLARMDSILEEWKVEGPKVLVLCSHGDWIPTAIQKLIGISISLKKSGWVEIQFSRGDFQLKWVVQKHY